MNQKTDGARYKLLSRVSCPEDIKGLSMSELELLAEEIRERIVSVVSQSGGHLASSLGVVELTIALHYAYDIPRDKLVWDVGHQCYAHKIITGRNDRFSTLRQEGGISGFPSIEESEYDCFNTGHAGTSISVALGFAQARDIKKENNQVVAVIGDGSLTAGLAFEGLNHAGSMHTNLTVIINDNKMSISPNVGALSKHLNRIITGKWFVRMEEEWDQVMNAIAGNQAVHLSHRIRSAVKGLIIPGKLFEDLGYKYIGPIDGHNISFLTETLRAVAKLRGPKIIHIVTTKGKGYKPAEEKSLHFHGVAPFHRETGLPLKRKEKKCYTDIFSDVLIKLASRDNNVVGITAGMPDGTGLSLFAKKYPDRFFDVGIAEQHATTLAAGMASEGLKPVVAIYSTFLQRVFDQIIHDVCLTSQNVTFAVDRAGIVGADGATHQGVFDYAYLRCAPNMVVMAPKDENELQHMFYTALEYNGPTAVRFPRGTVLGVTMDEELKAIPIGKAELLRDGTDICLIAIGGMVENAVKAADILDGQGYSVAVVNARFAKPIDQKLITEMSQKCDMLMTIEENTLPGGFGSAVLECVEVLPSPLIPVRRHGIPDHFVEHGDPNKVRAKLGLDSAGIAKLAKDFIVSATKKKQTKPAILDNAKEKTAGSVSS